MHAVSDDVHGIIEACIQFGGVSTVAPHGHA